MRRLLYLLALLLLMSCVEKTTFKESNFTFKIPQKEIYVKASKRLGGTFVLFFAKDSLSLTDCKDSITFEVGEFINLIVDSTDVYARSLHSIICSIGREHFNIKVASEKTFNQFFDNYIIKIPYSYIEIDAKEYHIMVNGQVIKQGNIYGE